MINECFGNPTGLNEDEEFPYLELPTESTDNYGNPVIAKQYAYKDEIDGTDSLVFQFTWGDDDKYYHRLPRETVKELLPYIQRFIETGELFESPLVEALDE